MADDKILKSEELGAISLTLEAIVKRIQDDSDKKREEELLELEARLSGQNQRPDQEGMFGIDKKWLGNKALAALGEWTPISVKPDANGQVSETAVKEALDAFLGLSWVDPDQDSRIFQVMAEAERAAKTDPHAISIVNAVKNYVIGSGVTINCSIQPMEDLLKDFWRRSSMERRSREAAARKFYFGEHEFFYFLGNKGEVTVRDRTKPYDIGKVMTHPDDAETRLIYERKLDNEEVENFADINYFSRLKADPWMKKASIDHRRLPKNILVQMCKYGDTSSVRGESQLYPVLRFLKFYYDFIVDRIVLNHERSKVVWIRTVKGSGTDFTRAQRAPQGGVVYTETDRLTWRTESANIGADDCTADGRLIRLAIAAGVGMPEHVIFQDPSNNVYASLRKQDTPYAQMIISHQQEWKLDYEEMFRTVFREAVTGGLLNPKTDIATYTLEGADRIYWEILPMVSQGASDIEIRSALEAVSSELPKKTITVETELVPVAIDFPSIVQEDPVVLAQTAEVKLRARLASRTTLAAELGYNLKQEELYAKLEGGWHDPGGKDTYGKKSNSPDNSNKPSSGE